jgi:hypothetical protein
MSGKIRFLIRLEDVKERLPVGVVPLYLKVWPSANISRLKNTVGGKIQDEQVLANLEALADTIERVNK